MAADKVVIVGGGISGLSTAYFLSRSGISSVIIEKAGRLGGLVKTDHVQGCDLEAGPDSFLAAKTDISDLASELTGLSGKIIGSNDKARRVFLVRGGKLVALPKGMAMMVPGEWGPALRSPLLSAQTKFKLLKETLTKPRTREKDFSVGEFVSDHFGAEVLEYLTVPLLCGVYGGDAAELSAPSVLPRFVGYEQQFGSLIKGVRAAAREKVPGQTPAPLFRSFEGGMQTLIEALAKGAGKSAAVIHSEVTRIDKVEDGWRVRFGEESISCRHLVLASPAHVNAKLLEKSAPAVAQQFFGIRYTASILVTLVFEKKTLEHPLDGFGFLVPEIERKTIAGATWVNTKFPSRIPDGLAALRAFVLGETASRLIGAGADDKQVTELVLQDFRRLMGISASPLFSTVYFWPRSMPQYEVGHEARMSRLQMEADQLLGLHLVGNIYYGIGLPDCVRRAKDVAKRIVSDGV